MGEGAAALVAPLFQALLGGLCLDIVNLWEDSQKPKSRRVEKDAYFIFFLFIWPLVGVVLAYVSIASGYRIDGWLAFTLGLTAPTTLQTIIRKSIPPDKPPPGAEPP
jgi:hypothetical protein